jgi:hypothetical protein
VVSKAPQASNKKRNADAQIALQQNEEFTFSDAEIGKFVPASLCKGAS